MLIYVVDTCECLKINFQAFSIILLTATCCMQTGLANKITATFLITIIFVKSKYDSFKCEECHLIFNEDILNTTWRCNKDRN